MTVHTVHFYIQCIRQLAVSVKANVREANVMPELKQAAYEGNAGVKTPACLYTFAQGDCCLFRWRLTFAQRKLCRSQNRQLMRGLTV